MEKDVNDLVRLTGAASQAEAGTMRELLQENGIFCYVKGEHHGALLGNFGAGAVGFDVMVRRADLGAADTLIANLRDAEPIWDESEFPEEEGDEIAPSRTIDVVKGKSAKKAAVLSLFPSLGFGHFYTGAFFRGKVLAATELVGIALLFRSLYLGLSLIVLAVATDMLGSIARVSDSGDK